MSVITSVADSFSKDHTVPTMINALHPSGKSKNFMHFHPELSTYALFALTPEQLKAMQHPRGQRVEQKPVHAAQTSMPAAPTNSNFGFPQ